jgi:hypothetical protein
MKEPRAKIIVMGDLNDDPYNNSCAVVMGAKKTREEVAEQGFFNTMWQKLDRGIGTLAYQGSWNLFDQIFISEPLMNAKVEDGMFKADVVNAFLFFGRDIAGAKSICVEVDIETYKCITVAYVASNGSNVNIVYTLG